MAMGDEDLVKELDRVRRNYIKWAGDKRALGTQLRFAQTIYFPSLQIGYCIGKKQKPALLRNLN